MKKMISMLALIGILVAVGGCAKAETVGYAILEVGGYDCNINGVHHNSDINLKSKETVEFKKNKERTINHRGVDYQVTYENTIQDVYYNEEFERYSMKDGVKFIQFEVNKKTGRVDGYYYIDKEYLNASNLEKKSREECLAIAQEYLASYIDDPEEYELSEEKYFESPEYEADYEFCFVRMINGVRTTDFARIRVTVHGIVTYHAFVCLGEMKGARLPDKEEMADIKENVEKKLDSIYERAKEKYDVSYELDKMEFARFEDGRYALDFHYTVKLHSLTSEEVIPIDDYTRLIVFLEGA